MKAKSLDRKFDTGEDITKYLDMSKARRPRQEQKRVNVDFPVWMIRISSWNGLLHYKKAPEKVVNRFSGAWLCFNCYYCIC